MEFQHVLLGCSVTELVYESPQCWWVTSQISLLYQGVLRFFKMEVSWLKKIPFNRSDCRASHSFILSSFNPHLLSTYYMLLIGIGLAKNSSQFFPVTVYENLNELSGQLRVLSTRRHRAWKFALFPSSLSSPLFVIMLLRGLGKLFFKKKWLFKLSV